VGQMETGGLRRREQLEESLLQVLARGGSEGGEGTAQSIQDMGWPGIEGRVRDWSMVQYPSSWITDGYPGNIHPRGFGVIQGDRMDDPGGSQCSCTIYKGHVFIRAGP
jgi:hypothetical protein